MQTFKDSYLTDDVPNQYCQKVKHSTSRNPLPVLAYQFFKISYLHTLKNTLFRTVDLILIVKSNSIIIILMNTDKKIRFLFKIYKNLKN